MTEHKAVEPVAMMNENGGLILLSDFIKLCKSEPQDFEVKKWFQAKPLGIIEPNTTTIPTAEYEQLRADAERWRYFIETASGEAAFELTGITDASNEQINEAIDQARNLI